MKKFSRAITLALLSFSALPLFTACAADAVEEAGEDDEGIGAGDALFESTVETSSKKVCKDYSKGKLVACTQKLCPKGLLSICPTSTTVRCCQ